MKKSDAMSAVTENKIGNSYLSFIFKSRNSLTFFITNPMSDKIHINFHSEKKTKDFISSNLKFYQTFNWG